MNTYIDLKIVKQFKLKIKPFEYSKLIKLLESLNKNYSDNEAHTCSIIIRAILDNIPPLLGYTSFEEVVNNHYWSSVNKKYMEKLLEFKNTGDDVLHTQISDKLDFLNIQSLPERNKINILLQECLAYGREEDFLKSFEAIKNKREAKSSKITVSLKEKFIGWGQYSVGNYIWCCFNCELKIDNRNGLDYLTPRLEATNGGTPWIASHFIFEIDRSKPEQQLEILPGKMMDIRLFISDSEPTRPTGHLERRKKTEVDIDTYSLVIRNRNGKDISKLKIMSGWIQDQM